MKSGIPDVSGKQYGVLENDRKTKGPSSRTQWLNEQFYNVHQKLRCTNPLNQAIELLEVNAKEAYRSYKCIYRMIYPSQ